MFGAVDVAAGPVLVVADLSSFPPGHYSIGFGGALLPLNPSLFPLQPDSLPRGQLARTHALADPLLLVLLTFPDPRSPRSFLRHGGDGQNQGEAESGKYWK